jgi:hypothetical protein
MTIWCILCWFGTFSQFWYHVPTKIWRPWLAFVRMQMREEEVSGNAMEVSNAGVLPMGNWSIAVREISEKEFCHFPTYIFVYLFALVVNFKVYLHNPTCHTTRPTKNRINPIFMCMCLTTSRVVLHNFLKYLSDCVNTYPITMYNVCTSSGIPLIVRWGKA